MWHQRRPSGPGGSGKQAEGRGCVAGAEQRSGGTSGRPDRRCRAMSPLSIVNIGLADFAGPPAAHGASVLHVDWRPPAAGDRELGLLLARMEDDEGDPIGSRVAQANTVAMACLLAARPMLVDVRPAPEGGPGFAP